MPPSMIDDTKPVPLEPTTGSVRDNFRVAKAEITDLQSRTSDVPATVLATSLMLAWRDETGTLQPLARVMIGEHDPAINDGRWLYLLPPL
jgi:hypothetical protein